MIATLYSIFGKTENYDNVTGSLTGLLIFLVGLIATFIIYSIYLVDETLDKNPTKKTNMLKTIIIGGFTISLIISIFVSFSINRYNFCKENQEICVLDYSFSPFA
jgi:hypothetical protein